MKNVLNILPHVGWLALIIVLWQSGCFTKEKIVEVPVEVIKEVTKIEKVPVQVEVPKFIEKIKRVEIPVLDQEAIDEAVDSLERELDYFREIVRNQEATIVALKAQEPVELPSFTVRNYKGGKTFTEGNKKISVTYDADVLGVLENMKLGYGFEETVAGEPKEETKPRKKRIGYISLGGNIDYDRNIYPELRVGWKNFYIGGNYDLSEQRDKWFKNVQLGGGVQVWLTKKE